MENTVNILATNIQTYRKKSGMTQEELANKLGVSFQAVSKWVNAKPVQYIC
ncbi:transcriptional regulator XRE family [Eubacterium sp. CAG:192]|nr:transcriptional regulator XRE family [Eubacterium sp. CAG:192]